MNEVGEVLTPCCLSNGGLLTELPAYQSCLDSMLNQILTLFFKNNILFVPIDFPISQHIDA